jgi:hypothetical protein
MFIVNVPMTLGGKRVSRRLAEQAAVEHVKREKRVLTRVVGVVPSAQSGTFQVVLQKVRL